MKHTETALNGHKPLSSLTPDTPIGVHKAKDLAETFGIAPATLSSRWYPWLLKVTEATLLKANGRYTDLAKELFEDYKAEVKDNGLDAWKWVASRKDVLQRETEAAPVEVEVVPNEAEVALVPLGETQGLLDDIVANFTASNKAIQLTATEIVEGAVFQETQTLEEELAIEALYGQRIGALKFAARKQAEISTMEKLKRQDLQGKRTEAAT